MLKRISFVFLLSLPLCAYASGGSLFHSSPYSETAAEVTTWRGERALKIPVQLSAVDWSKAGFPASSNAETQTAWLYITETAFQLQDGAGHTLMGGPRSDIGLEMTQCIRMRSMKVSVCANSSFPQTKEAREMLRGSQTEFSWLYYHLGLAGKNAPAAPNGTMMLAGAPGSKSSSVAPPVLECRLVNPDGSTAVALGGPGVNPAPAAAASEPLMMAASPAPASAPVAAPAPQPVVAKSMPAPAKADVPVHVAAAPAEPPAPQIDHAARLRALAAASHPALMESNGKQPSTMLESPSKTMASVPSPHMPIHVEEHDIAPPAPVAVAAAPKAPTRSTMSVPAAAPPAPVAVARVANVPQPKPAMAAASQPAPEDDSDMASDDLTPAGAPRGVVPERRAKVVTVAAPVAAKPATDSHAALVEAEKEARAARVAEMQLRHAQDLKAIPSTSESRTVPVEKPSSAYANHITTSTVFSKPAYAEPESPKVHVSAATSFAAVATPDPQLAAAAAAGQEIAQASDAQTPAKPRHIERPAFKSVTLPSPVETEQ